MLNHLDPEKKKSKYQELLKKLIKEMAMADSDKDEESSPNEVGDSPMSDSEDEDEDSLMSESEVGDDESELPDEELSDEDRMELLSRKNSIPKKKEGMVAISIMAGKPGKQGKGRPKGSKSRY